MRQSCDLIVAYQGKRSRNAPKRFEDQHATIKIQEDKHNQAKYKNKYARAELVEAVTQRVFDLRVHQMVEEWYRIEVALFIPSSLPTNMSAVRKEKEARKERHAPDAAAAAVSKDATIAKWTERADKAILELSWR